MNDSSGVERDEGGVYYGAGDCMRSHFVMAGGVMVPAAKRPSTRSYPAPGAVNIHSRIRWLVANPYVTIANDPPFDPRPAPRPTASFTYSANFSLGTIHVDAGGSRGDIVRYVWDADWTTGRPDLVATTPTAELPLLSEGVLTLTVVGRDGQAHTVEQQVDFRPRASFTFSTGRTTLWVDASASQGDIVRYVWDLDWTSAVPDAEGTSPTAEFPLLVEGSRTSGRVTLTVIGRDGQTGIALERVELRPRIRPIPRSPGVPRPDRGRP